MLYIFPSSVMKIGLLSIIVTIVVYISVLVVVTV